MTDFTNAKGSLNSVYPVGSQQAVFRDSEPLLTAALLRRRHLFGIPLVSPYPDPITRKPMILQDADLDDTIQRACALAESNNFYIFPRTFGRKYPWDRNLFLSLGYTMLEQRPVYSIQKIEVRPATGQTVFSIPLDWVETANLAKGQINIIPINVATITGGQILSSGGNGNGSFFLSMLGSMGWIPAYWWIEYTCGFPEGQVPKLINEAIGVQSAILVLQQLQAARALVNSQSVGMDGFNQSVSGQGGQTYKPAIELLMAQLTALQRKIKVYYGLSLFVGTI